MSPETSVTHISKLEVRSYWKQFWVDYEYSEPNCDHLAKDESKT